MALPAQMRGGSRPTWLLLALLAVVLGLMFVAGCGGDDEPSSGAPTTGPGSATTAPDAIGTDIADAAEDFADAGLRVSIDYIPSNEPAGTVATQANPAGTELQRGDTVGLGVSTGTPTAGEPPRPRRHRAAGVGCDGRRWRKSASRCCRSTCPPSRATT